MIGRLPKRQLGNVRPSPRSLAFLWAMVSVSLFVASNARADQPEIDRIIQSSGGSVGTQFTVRVEGRGLDSIRDVMLLRPKVRLISFLERQPDFMTMRLEAERECFPGEHPFVLVSGSGVSRLASFQVDPFEVQTEIEPNDNPARAIKLELPITVTGVIEEGDEDCFTVELKKGQRLSAEVTALPLSRFLFDAAIEVLDPNGNRIASADDNPLTAQDPLLTLIAPDAGRYVLRVREAAYGGDLDARYRLHLSDEPRPTVAFPAEKIIDQESATTLLGDAGGPLEYVFGAQARPHDTGGNERTGTFHLSRPDASSPALPALPSLSSIRLCRTDSAGTRESEPNDSATDATNADRVDATSQSFAFNGILSEPMDVDWFTADLRAGEVWIAEVFAHRLGSPVDATLDVFGSGGHQIARSDDGVMQDSLIRFRVARSGQHQFRVTDHLGRGTPSSVYRLELRRPTPELEVNVIAQDEDMPESLPTILVPRGQRVPVRVSCLRSDFSGPVDVDLTGLPDGVSFESSGIDSGNHLALGFLSAAEHASPGASWVTLQGVAETNERMIRGRHRQRVGMVFGEPRKTIYHHRTLDRVPLLVTDRSPVDVQVTPPELSLVPDGQLELRVRVLRNDDFDRPVNLRLIAAPAWLRPVESEVTVDAASNEATFALSSSESIELKSWPLSLVAIGHDQKQHFEIAANSVNVRVDAAAVDLKLDRAVAKPGESTEVVGHLNWRESAEPTEYMATLVGLPSDVTGETVKVQTGQRELRFQIKVGDNAPVAVHNTLSVDLVRTINGASQTHHLGRGGELEVVAKNAAPTPQKSRLEQLREQLLREQQGREQQGQGQQ